MPTEQSLDDLFNEEEARLEKASLEELSHYFSQEEILERVRNRKAEFDKGVRLGWWDEDGNPLTEEEPEEEPEEDEDEEEI